MFRIVPAAADLMPQLIPLIDAYQLFYNVPPNSKRNLHFFSELLNHPEQAIQFVAVDSLAKPIGFATLYFLPSSLSAQTYCLMNDLFALPQYRGRGVGKALLSHCQAFAKEKGFPSMEWMTQETNSTAQNLYDSLPAEKTKWFYYSLSTK